MSSGQPATDAAADLGAAWQYEVQVSPGAAELHVDARFAPGPGALGLDRDAARFVRDVEYASGAFWQRAPGDGAEWTVPCQAAGCRVRYRFALRDAAESIDDIETAMASGGVVVAPPSSWLLHPASRPGERLRFHVSHAPADRFAAGTMPAPDGAPDTYEAGTDAIDAASFAVFGAFEGDTLARGRSRIEVAVAPSRLALSPADAVAWVATGVDAVAGYFAGFPAAHVLVVVLGGGSGPTRGETLDEGGPAIVLSPASTATAASLRDDWVATHELLHAVLPSFARRHIWLSEGIASYVEPIARVRAGTLSQAKMWGDLVAGMPQGLPEAGDEGLDRTHTWGRTYWGGALFCLEADVTIRQQTQNAHSFDDVLRAAAKGGDAATLWTIERFLDEGDRATGTQVLHDLYREMAIAPGTVDLPALWARLGVREGGHGVTFDDGAPLASVRRAIARP